MDTQTQIDRLIELAIIQRSELKQLVEQLPQLREHLNAEVEKVFDETEPQLRAELEEWTTKQTADKTAALGVALEAKIADLAKTLEVSTQARYNAIIAERAENARLAAQAEAKIAEHAASLPSAVKDIVTAELARFPRAGEIDQLRKEFAEPRGLNPRGKWQAGETYNKLDLVTINGDSYTSNTDGNRTRPSRSSADWTLVAARGTGGGGGPTSLSELTTVPSDGDVLIGSGTSWVTSNLTAGAGISITVGPGAITISATDGDITLDDGTAASPSLHFTNDPDTGIYRPAANTLGISVSGAQVAYFDANGITTVGAGATFDGSVHAANGNANNPSLSFTSDDNTGFFRHQPDEIGITLGGTQTGTLTSALATLTSKLLVSSGATTTAATDLLVNPAVKASGNLLDLQVASSSKFSVSSAGNGTFGGNLTVSGTGTSTFSGPIRINATASAPTAGSFSTSAGNGLEIWPKSGSSYDLLVYTAAGSSLLSVPSGTNNLTLAGNLTVSGGTATISKSSTTTGPVLQLENTNDAIDAGGTLGRLQFYSGDDSGGGNSVRAWIDSIQTTTTPVGSALRFAVANGANAAGEVVRIAETGNLLIGTTTDGGQKLQVAGTGLFSTTEPTITLSSTAVGSIAYQLISGGGSGHTLGAFKIYDSSTGYVVLNHDKPTSGGTRLSFDGAGNATFAGKVTANGAQANYTINAKGFIQSQGATGNTRGFLIYNTDNGQTTQLTSDGLTQVYDGSFGLYVANTTALLLYGNAGSPLWRWVPWTSAGIVTNDASGYINTSKSLPLLPITAPAAPASGWLLYTDSADSNKLKAKASTGTVVTLGTP